MNQHTKLWFALCVLSVGLTAYLAKPGVAQEEAPVGVNLPGTVTKTCTVDETGAEIQPPGCIVMFTSGNHTATRWIMDITTSYSGRNNNVFLLCRAPDGASLINLEIAPDNGGLAAMSCPPGAHRLEMLCMPGVKSCQIEFAID
jgi:hypothetical protein